MLTFLIALGAVFLAEMGDKSQLLALAFASRYRWTLVLWAIACATGLNHLLAVAAGNLCASFIPLVWVRLAAAIAFLAFGLWTLCDDPDDGPGRSKNRSAFWTVFIAFFLVEMGDKTQLLTITLALKETGNLFPVWLGSTLGMVAADALGIAAGILLHKRIPTRGIKWVAASSFALFGLWALSQCLHEIFPSAPLLPIIIPCSLAPIMLILMLLIARSNKQSQPPES